MENTTCPKCGGAMRRGFLLERGHRDMRSQTIWCEGEAEFDFWNHQKNAAPCRIVTAYRCERCAFVEMYADGGETWV